jgi:hypothetical protein
MRVRRRRKGWRRFSVLYAVNIILKSAKRDNCTYFAARAFLRARLRRGMNAASARLHDEDEGLEMDVSMENMDGLFKSMTFIEMVFQFDVLD